MIVSGAGAEDPWEKVEWGRKLQHYPSVEEFVAFPGEQAICLAQHITTAVRMQSHYERVICE